ncbi:MAG: DUF362 domain-containing protein [bacterium]
MARVVEQETCVGCGSCVDSCPVGAIDVDAGYAVIDADACIDCGACEGTCPVEAISEG